MCVAETQGKRYNIVRNTVQNGIYTNNARIYDRESICVSHIEKSISFFFWAVSYDLGKEYSGNKGTVLLLFYWSLVIYQRIQMRYYIHSSLFELVVIVTITLHLGQFNGRPY